MARSHASSVINAPIDQVWTHIRDFGGLSSWHPAVSASVIEDGRPSCDVGCIRDLTLGDGGKLRERLLAFSDDETFYTYSILESPMPVANYKATLRLLPISDGNRTYGEWTAQFDPAPPEAKDEIETFISTAVFQGGFDALKQHFGG